MGDYADKEIVTSEGDVVAFNGSVIIQIGEVQLPFEFINEDLEPDATGYDFAYVYEALEDYLQVTSFEGKEFNVYFIYE